MCCIFILALVLKCVVVVSLFGIVPCSARFWFDTSEKKETYRYKSGTKQSCCGWQAVPWIGHER